jgi:hypothetical protein
VALDDLIVEDNKGPIEQYGCTGHGAGLWIHDSSVEIVNTIIRDNCAFFGGGMHATWSTILLSNVRFESNVANHFYNSWIGPHDIGGFGGGLFGSHVQLTLVNVAFLGNEAVMGFPMGCGGGMYLQYSAVAMRHCIFVGNAAPWGSSGGMSVESTSLSCDGCLWTGNLAGTIGAIGVSRCDPKDLLSLDHSALGKNSTPAVEIHDVSFDPGTLPTQPVEFLDVDSENPSDWDLHLVATSPLVDAGNPAVTDPDASRSDIGIYGGPGAAAWDLDFDGYPEWWHPGPYDPAVDPGQGWDCDDSDPTVHPGSGC